MPKQVKLKADDMDELVNLIMSGAAKGYICRKFGIAPAQLKKIKKQLKLK